MSQSWREVKLQMIFDEDHEKTFTVLRQPVKSVNLSKLRYVDRIHVPRSLVTYRKRFRYQGVNLIEFTLPQWKVEQEKLEDYEI